MQVLKKRPVMRTVLPIRALAVQQFLALVGKAPTVKGLARTPRWLTETKTVKKREMLAAETECVRGSKVYRLKVRDARDFCGLTASQASEIGRTLGFLHKNGIRHGDLSLGNVVRTKNQQVKFIDFEAANISGKKRTLFEASLPTNLLPDSPEVKHNPSHYFVHEGNVYKRKSPMLKEAYFKGEPAKQKTTMDELSKFLEHYKKADEAKNRQLRLAQGLPPEALKNVEQEYVAGKKALEALIKSYMKEFSAPPLTFKGKSVFDYKRLPFVRDIE